MTDREREEIEAEDVVTFEADEDQSSDVDETGFEAEEAEATAQDEIEEAETGGVVATGMAVGVGTRPTASLSELAVHVDDRISAIFVLAVIAVFIAILVYGIVGGVGGVVTGTPTPTPSPSPTASASP
jgi:hypothetical protein